MISVPYRLETTNDNLTSRAGMACIGEVMNAVDLTGLVNRHFPKPGSNRGYLPSDYVNTFMMMLHEGGRCLEDVRHLKSESKLMSLLGLKALPSSDALGDWLRRVGQGKAGLNALAQINQPLLKAALHRCQQVTLDIDATPVLCDKVSSNYTYLKEPGYMPMVGHIEQTDQIASMQFRRGNVPPCKANLAFIQQCESALPPRVRVNRLRIDAAGYQHAILDYAFDHDMAFAIRAKLTSNCRDLILSRPESDWQPFIRRDSTVSQHQSTCRMTHMMNESKRPFTLIVQRSPKQGQQEITFNDHNAVESIEHEGYIYRAIATNRENLNDSELIHWYNQRAEHSENRIKELKKDFAGEALPCSEFKANELYFALCGLAYNLFALMRHLLPIQWAKARVTTIRWRLYALAGKIITHGRTRIIKLQKSHRDLLNQALLPLRQFALPP